MNARSLLTSTQVADLLQASPTSVKRWADAGLLRCVRTAGGHRRFRPEDVDLFQRQQRQEGPAQETTDVDEWIVDLLLNRPYRVLSRLYDARSRLGSWAAVCDGLGPVLREIGESWARGELTVVEEHMATELLTRGLTRVAEGQLIPDNAPSAMLMTLEQEDHTLGLSFVELALRELGWRPVWAGRSTPIDGLGAAMDSYQVDALCVSSSEYANNDRRMADAAAQLAALCKSRGVILVLGGGGAWPSDLAGAHRLTNLVGLRAVLAGQVLAGQGLAGRVPAGRVSA